MLRGRSQVPSHKIPTLDFTVFGAPTVIGVRNVNAFRPSMAENEGWDLYLKNRSFN
jgi:hypothetical protein